MKRILPTKPGQSVKKALYVPDFLADSIRDIDFALLKSEGIRCVALDIDSTLAAHGAMELDSETVTFLKELRDSKVIEKICIATNRGGRTVTMKAANIHADYIVHAEGLSRKPSHSYYDRVIKALDCKPNEIVMVGDKIVQDIFGAKRSGLKAILVEPVGPPSWFDRLLLLRWRQKRVRRHWTFEQQIKENASMPAPGKPAGPNLFGILKPYRKWVAMLVLFTILSNALNLVLPLLISRGIDAYANGTLVLTRLAIEFSIAALLIFVFSYIQNIVQTYVSELVARDMRTDLSREISLQSNAYVQKVTSETLLTNLTSDIDGVKLFVSQAIASLISSIFLIIGSSVLLLIIDWPLALAVLTIIPLIGGTFFFVFSKVRTLFLKGQEVIDWLNRVINESILGSALIRVLNSQAFEYDKFIAANTDAKNTGMKILKLFAVMIPIIMFVSNMATVIILTLGGHFIITGELTLGEFTAFNSYVAILIFPIIIIGFMSTVIARASASYKRISDVLTAEKIPDTGTREATLKGNIELQKVSIVYGEKSVLKDASFQIQAGTKNAIIGPTAAGKTQLLSLLTGLLRPTSGTVLIDGHPLDDYKKSSLHSQIGFVFQGSVLFNVTLRKNIAFSEGVSEEALQRAIVTAELSEFIASLPEGLETIVSERGTSLSGGQKQRIMLARALALEPKVLLLDDFTARVDTATEERIIANLAKNYPGITLISVTQKIGAIEHFDQIILLMEGEVLATGTHKHLMETSPEYVQIADSQRSTATYE